MLVCNTEEEAARFIAEANTLQEIQARAQQVLSAGGSLPPEVIFTHGFQTPRRAKLVLAGEGLVLALDAAAGGQGVPTSMEMVSGESVAC